MSSHAHTAPRLILPVLCACSFAVPINNYILSPLLVELSGDLRVSLATAGLLGVAFAGPASIAALLIGPFSDKYGRRPVLAAGIGLLALSNLLSAVAWSFPSLAAFRVVGGLGTAALSPTMFAAVGDAFPYEERGKGISTLLSANMLASVIGIPIAALLAGLFHWRVAFGFVGSAMLIALVVFLLAYPRVAAVDAGRPLRDYFRDYGALFRQVSVLSIWACILLNAVGWVAWITYMGAFFVERYGLATAQLSLVSGSIGVGVVIGSTIGGRLGDRGAGHKPVVVATALIFGALLVLQTNVVSAVGLAIAMNVLLAVPMGARFASMLTMLSEQNPEARGRLLALNTNGFQGGVVIGAAMGGWAVESAGYGALGWISGALIVLSGGVIALWASESRVAGPKSRVGGVVDSAS